MNSQLIPLLIGLIVSILGFNQPQLKAQSGGPDDFGYTWLTSDAPTGPEFRWVDLPSLPNAVLQSGLDDENSIGPIALGFDFRYFWRDQNSITVGSNGWLGFDYVPNLSWCFQSLPSANNTPNNILAPLMVDLNFGTKYPTLPNPGEVWFWTNQADSAIISYHDAPFWKDDQSGTAPPDWGGGNTFQIILDASDSSITYQYLHLDDALFINYAICPRDLIVGYEGPTGKIGDEMFREVVPDDSFTIRIVHPTQDTFQVQDAAPLWTLTPESKAKFVLVNTPVDIETQVSNLGNAPLDSGTIVTHRIFDPQFNFIWFRRDTLESVAPGTVVPVEPTYSSGLTKTGGHFVRTSVQAAADPNTLNNDLFTELNVVADTGNQFQLSYATGGQPITELAFPGSIGDYGAGIFIDYPYHDIKIRAVEVFIAGDGNVNTPMPVGFRLDLYADGLNGPGPQLASELVPSTSVIEEDWNLIEFDPPVAVDSGRVFVGWIQGGDGVGIGVETESPISRRSYEIINGQWAPFRRNNLEELLLKVHAERTLVGREKPVERGWSVEITPNPSRGEAVVIWDQKRAGAMKMEVFDMQGKRVLEKKWPQRGPGIYREKLSAELSPGVFTVIFSNKWGRSSQKWVLMD